MRSEESSSSTRAMIPESHKSGHRGSRVRGPAPGKGWGLQKVSPFSLHTMTLDQLENRTSEGSNLHVVNSF